MASSMDKEILDLETRFWKAIQDRNVDAALDLLDDTSIVTGAQGVSQIDKKTFAKMMETGKWTLHDFSFSEVKVQRLGDDAAVIGYKVEEKLTVDGKPMTLEAADASAWVKRDGRWVCALHTESVKGDPFGRDRAEH
jgi:uncharacterized protein (TIGR02246 family)